MVQLAANSGSFKSLYIYFLLQGLKRWKLCLGGGYNEPTGSLVPRPSHCPVLDCLQCKRSETGRWEGLGTRLSCRFVVNRVGSVPSFLNWIHSGFGFSCIIPRVCAIYVRRLKIHLETKIAMGVVAKCSRSNFLEGA